MSKCTFRTAILAGTMVALAGCASALSVALPTDVGLSPTDLEIDPDRDEVTVSYQMNEEPALFPSWKSAAGIGADLLVGLNLPRRALPWVDQPNADFASGLSATIFLTADLLAWLFLRNPDLANLRTLVAANGLSAIGTLHPKGKGRLECKIRLPGISRVTGNIEVSAENSNGKQITHRTFYQASPASKAWHPERRIALVIGNSKYQEAPLRNPGNDARGLKDRLVELGFDPTLRENLSRQAFLEEATHFGKKLRGSDVGLFYFAGHGIQVDGKNYLVPVDAHVRTGCDMEKNAVQLDDIVSQMKAAKNRLNILILDACRDNPFPKCNRSLTRGLAPVSGASDFYIAYATAPGEVALDGTPGSDHGVYTGELLNAIAEPGRRIEDVFMKVRSAVMKRTNNQQVPWESGSLTHEFYFKSKWLSPSLK